MWATPDVKMGRVHGRPGLAALLVTALAAGCAPGSRSAPTAGSSSGAVPSLPGVRVLVFPFQAVEGLTGQADAELAYALDARDDGVAWILPDESREALRMSPSLQVSLTGLPVAMFLGAEVHRVGDPLFGILRRLGALMDAPVALIPIVARYRPEAADRPGAAEVAAALLNVRDGRVLWFGVVEGGAGPAADPRVLATAVDALVRTLTPWVSEQ